MWKSLYFIMRLLAFHYPRMAFWVLLEKLGVVSRLSEEAFHKLQLLAFVNERYLMPQDGGGINSLIKWQLLNWKSDLPSLCSDRFAVRDFVRQRVGGDILIPLLPDENSVWEDADAVDFARLPDKFVLKCTSGSGMVMIVRDKRTLDLAATRATLREWLASDFASCYHETQYAKIKNRIVCEKLLETDDGKIPMDYKIMCSNGKPIYSWVDADRFGDHTRLMMDANFNRVECWFALRHPDNWREIKKPDNWDEMLAIASKLSAGIPFVRVDFYNLNGHIYFGEMTFTTEGGIGKIEPFSFSQKWAREADISSFVTKETWR